ncbi:MAG: hypothetical protein ABI597_03115 [Gammaproteobacteria bacterium]
MLACLLSFVIGFLSLSIEILWIRIFTYANHSLPQAFSFVLTFYLIGIALGAALGKRFCQSSTNLWAISGVALTIASVFDLLSPWIYTEIVNLPHQLIGSALLILISSLLKAIVFPIAHHLGTLDNKRNIGQKISKVYVSNIFGSTLGPLVMGFVLLSFFTTQQCFAICAAMVFMTGMLCLSTQIRAAYLILCSACAIYVLFTAWAINPNLLIASLSARGMKIHRIVENQYGVITTYFASDKGGDIVTGGNVYDGRTNLDPIINSNKINRVIILSALQEHPANILLVGLSIGTWLKLINTFPGVKNIDVVEINPGYLQAIKDYPDHASALSDPRVKLYIDDGRRWLKMHSDKKYDLIIMNTTHYWRAYSSNLLSREFVSILRQHMNKNAVLSYNTTDSPDAFKTATTLFKHAYLYQNFVIAADFDWRIKLHEKNAENKLAKLQLNGKRLFPTNSESLIRSFLQHQTYAISEIERIYSYFDRDIKIITDRNLLTEYKYGKNL